MILDPCHEYEHASYNDLIAACGVLPYWALNPKYRDLPAVEALDAQYPFGLFEMRGGEVREDGAYIYPGDPPLWPIAKILRDREWIYFYPHAIVAIVSINGKDQYVTRMD